MTTEITKGHLADDLMRLGIKAGDHVGLALSFKSLGRVTGGPDAFIDALLDVVGSEGTIMANTYTANMKRSSIAFSGADCIYDSQSSHCNTGIIPETIRLRHNALRSRHPVMSVAAIGSLAEFLTAGHDENAPAYLPYSRLAEAGGMVLSIGLGDRLVGLRHEAQYLAGLLTVVPLKRGALYRDANKKIREFQLADHGGCTRRLPEMVPLLRRKGIVHDGPVGRAKALLAPAGEALTVMTDLLKQDPTLYLCNAVGCLWCREIERRLNLYSKIKNPRYFQRYRSVIRITSWINRARLNDYRWVAWLKHQAKKIGTKR